jgi:hypothetical protein
LWRSAERDYTAACLAGIVGCILVVGSFVGTGGSSSGPRYLIIALPCFCLLMPRWSQLTHYAQWIVGGLAAISFSNMLVIAAVCPMVNKLRENIWRDYLYGPLVSGVFPRRAFLPHGIFTPPDRLEKISTFNWGNLLFGLEGLPSLILLIFLLALCLWFIRHAVTKSP